MFICPQDKVNEFSTILTQQFTPNVATDKIFTDYIMRTLDEPLQLSPHSTFITPNDVTINKSPTKKSPGHDHSVKPLLKNLLRKALVQFTQIYNSILRLL